jgi:hypothetical protein
MKKLFIILFFAFSLNTYAQITLEHVYDSAATNQQCDHSQLMMINFEVSGPQYVKINRCGYKISIYKLDHSLIKNISLQNVPLNSQGGVGDILYISEKLFNNDAKIEFMYCSDTYYTRIYNEDGVVLFSEFGYPWIKVNYMQQQFPIYNSPTGTKMILSYANGQAKVFSLPGTLSPNIVKANNLLLQQNGLSDAYPNPTANTTQIDYTLPNGINEGEIVLFDLQGTEIKRYTVDRTFSSLLVSVSDIPAGTYYYQLQTASHNSEGKKMVVIK